MVQHLSSSPQERRRSDHPVVWRWRRPVSAPVQRTSSVRGRIAPQVAEEPEGPRRGDADERHPRWRRALQALRFHAVVFCEHPGVMCRVQGDASWGLGSWWGCGRNFLLIMKGKVVGR